MVGRIIGVSALLALGTGLVMVRENDAIVISDLWVWLSLALFGVTVILGAAFSGRPA